MAQPVLTIWADGHITLLPPPPGLHPAISADAADALAGRDGELFIVPPVPRPHLVLTKATISDYGGPNGLIVDHRLMWVIIFANVRVRPIGGIAVPRASIPKTSTTVARFTGTVLSFVDATTGVYTNTEAV